MNIGDKGLPKCTIDIVIEGFEQVHWIEGTGTAKRPKNFEYKDSKKTVDLRFKIMESDGFKKGDYEFPLKFNIPSGIPGTFIHHSTVSASLTYVMYCEIIQDSKCVGSKWHPLIIMQND